VTEKYELEMDLLACCQSLPLMQNRNTHPDDRDGLAEYRVGYIRRLKAAGAERFDGQPFLVPASSWNRHSSAR
jgi:hypothetical protein